MPGANIISYTSFQPSSQFAPGLDGTTGVEAGLPAGAQGCIISVENCGIRWRADGTVPTTGTGHPLAAASTLTFDSWTAPGNNWKQVMKKIKIVGSSATATIHVSFFD